MGDKQWLYAVIIDDLLADVGGKQLLYAVFSTESEPKSLFAASIGWKWSIENVVYCALEKRWMKHRDQDVKQPLPVSYQL